MKKGFTLIELLAVIVILAIISLIAVPVVVNIINDSKSESKERSIDLYIDHVQKAITKYQMANPGFNPSTCKIEEKGSLNCNGTEIQVEMKGQGPESGTIKFKNNKVTYNVILEDIEYTISIDGVKQNNPAPSLATGEDYRGYYADVDGDGQVDGIIYADLNKSESGNWSNYMGFYLYAKESNLNEYTVSNNTYKKNDGFGENKIIKLKKDKGNARFYVMALEDFTTEAYEDPNDSNNNYPAYIYYYWYKDAYNHMNPQITEAGFGKGKQNTRKMIAKWKAAGTSEGYVDSPQNNQDIWKHIDGKYQEGWYIPSREEWAAFGDYFSSKEENKLTSDYESGSYVYNSGNYNSLYGLSGMYWSSSQTNTGISYTADNGFGQIGTFTVTNSFNVRLGTTF